MTGFQWSEAFEVGDADLDAQHKGIAARLTDLMTALEAGREAEARQLCRQLRRQLETHAAYEEAALAAAGFPRVPMHAETHRCIARNWVRLIGACGERCADYRRIGCVDHIVDDIVRNEIIADLDYKAFLQERPRGRTGNAG